MGLLIWAYVTKLPERRKKLVFVSLLILFLASNKVLVNEITRAWELEPRKEASIPETAVILGGYAEFDAHRNRVQMSDAADRLYSVVNLYQQKRIKRIILSGGSSSVTGRTKPEADYVLPILKNYGIPDSSVIKESKSRNTHENALNTAKILKEKHIEGPILLVTSSFHMRRSMGTFTKAGIDVRPYPVHFISDYGRGYFLPDFFIPSSEALFRCDAIIKEWVGYLAYAITGKL
ncbi:MAG: YdcF family protein [Sphingomonadales bacterium]